MRTDGHGLTDTDIENICQALAKCPIDLVKGMRMRAEADLRRAA